MKLPVKQEKIFVFLIGILIVTACNKSEVSNNSSGIQPPPPPPSPISNLCGNRPVINAKLVPVSNLSSARVNMQCASAGNKILFIGGWHSGPNYWNEPVPIDIFDISSNTWSFHSLVPDDPMFSHFRYGAAIASVGNKILIGGGGDGIGDNQTSRVDIYDASTDTWAKENLRAAKQGLAAATVGDKVLFAGGFGYPDGSNWGCFNSVDIYDNSSNTWSSAVLSEARMDLTATTHGNKIYFAGGWNGVNVSKKIDIYDPTTNSWSVSSLQVPRANMASIAVDDKIYWAGGGYSLTQSGWAMNSNVEILNTSTGVSSMACILGRSNIIAAKKDENIIFFTGLIATNDPHNGIDFEIYNTTTDTWSVGRLNQKVFNAAVISVNNTIYVAGGSDGNTYFNQVWKLEF